MATIVLVHGAWVGPWSLERSVLAARERGHDARAPDLVPAARAGASLEEHADVVRAVLDEVGGAVLWGQSLGAVVALHVAVDPRVEALVLQSMPSTRGALELPPAFQLGLRRYAGDVLRGRSFELRRDDARRLFFGRVPEREAEEALDRYTAASGRALRELVLGVAGVDAGAVRCPVLVVTGEHDEVSGPRVARRIARRLRADYHEVAGGGHSMGLGPGWEEHAAAVLDWVERR